MVFQDFALWPHLSVYENVAFVLQQTWWSSRFTRNTHQIREQVLEVLQLLKIDVGVVVISSALAAPLAFSIENTKLGQWRFIDIVCMIPFMTPPFINSIGWILFMQPNGYFAHIFYMSSLVKPLFFSPLGLMLIMSLHLYPILYFAIRPTLTIVNGRLDEVARIFGLPKTSQFFRIWMPLLIRPLLGAGVLVFVKSIGEFGTPLIFGNLLNYPVLTTAIYKYISTWPISFSMAAQLSFPLLVISFVAWYCNTVYQSRHTYPLLSGKSIPSKRKTRVAYIGLLYTVLLLTISIGIPFGSILFTSILRIEGFGLQWNNLTFQHFLNLFQIGSDGLYALLTSVELSISAALICTILGLMIASICRFTSSRLTKIIDFLVLLPNTIPDVLVVIGMILFWNAPIFKWTIYNTPWMHIAPMLASPPNLLTTSTFIFNQFEQGDLSDGMAMAVITVLVSVVISILIRILIKDKSRNHTPLV